MSYISLAIGFAGAVFFYKAALHENLSPYGWIALSIGASALVILLGDGALMMALGQLALLPAIALWRVWREDSKQEAEDTSKESE